MATAERERKSARFYWILIAGLLVGYIAIKSHHIALAIEVYRGQPLTEDTSGAAK